MIRLELVGYQSIDRIIEVGTETSRVEVRFSRPEAPSPTKEAQPAFPWPPPAASASQVLPRDLLLAGELPADLRLRFLDGRLRAALEAAGYAESSYYLIPDGFAILTRIEQIDPDGRPRPPPNRWSIEPGRIVPFSLAAYLRALFTANPGYYRVIAFLVTDRPFHQSGERLSRERAMEMVRGGLNTLPASVAGQPYSPEYQCTALIYEFESPQTSGTTAQARLLLPSRLDARTHLINSGLWAALSGSAPAPTVPR